MAAKSWCYFITESAFITPVTISTIDADHLVLDLPDDDAISIRQMPNREQLMTAKSRGGPDRAVGDSYSIAGAARGLLYPNQAPLLVGWAAQLVDQDASPDEPWTTTEPNGDLASATFSFAYEDWGFTTSKRRYRGCKAQSFTLETARGTRGGVVQWSADVVGSDQASSTDTEPALSTYPTLAPYHISDTTLKVNNTTISNYESLNLSIQNTLEVAFDESTTAAVIRLQSRTVNLTVTGALKGTPDWETLLTGQALLGADTNLILLHPGNNHQIEFDFHAAARVTNWTRNLRMQQRPNQTLELIAQYDRSQAEDFTVTFSDPTP